MAETEDQTPPEPAPEAEEAPRPSRSGWGLRIAKLAVAAVLGLALLIGLAIFGLDTGPGRRFVADQIKNLEFENGMKIDVGRIEGSLYGKMVLQRLSIRDPKGEFLYSPEVHVDWRPFAYLRSHIDVHSATAARMILRRSPEFKVTAPSDAPLRWPSR